MDATKTRTTRLWKRVDESSHGTVEQYIVQGAEGQLVRFEDRSQGELLSLPNDFVIPANFIEIPMDQEPAEDVLERLSSH